MSQPGFSLKVSRRGFDVATWAFGCGYVRCHDTIFGSQQGGEAIRKSGVATLILCHDRNRPKAWQCEVLASQVAQGIQCRDTLLVSRPGLA